MVVVMGRSLGAGPGVQQNKKKRLGTVTKPASCSQFSSLSVQACHDTIIIITLAIISTVLVRHNLGNCKIDSRMTHDSTQGKHRPLVLLHPSTPLPQQMLCIQEGFALRFSFSALRCSFVIVGNDVCIPAVSISFFRVTTAKP